MNLTGNSGAPVFAEPAPLSDSLPNPTTTEIGAHMLVFNGTTWDRRYNNTQGTLLASAARTAGVTSAVQTNYNARGVLLFLNVDAASGTGGLQVTVQTLDPISGVSWGLNSAPTAVTTTGLKVYGVYPTFTGVSGTNGGAINFNQLTPEPLPRIWQVNVAVGDASSYTYSIGYALIN